MLSLFGLTNVYLHLILIVQFMSVEIKDSFEIASGVGRSSRTGGVPDARQNDQYLQLQLQKGHKHTLKIHNQIIFRPGDAMPHNNTLQGERQNNNNTQYREQVTSKTEAVQLSAIKIIAFLMAWIGEALLFLFISPNTFFFFCYVIVAGGVYIISNICYYCVVTPARMHQCYAWALLFQSKSYGCAFNAFCGILIGICVIPFTYFGFISFIAVMFKTKKFPERVPVDLKCRKRDCYDYYPGCRQSCSCCCCFKVPVEDTSDNSQGLHN